MSTFYQIVTRQDCNGSWFGFFADHPEIYRSYDEAYKKAEELAVAKTQEPFREPLKDYLRVQYRTEKDKTIIEIFDKILADVVTEYHVKELTLV